MASPARRNRLVSAGFVAAFLMATHVLWPDSLERSERQYFLVITLGYGHLIGAAVFSRRRIQRLAPEGVPWPLFSALAGVSALDLFALYAWLSNVSARFVLPLLAVSLWHIVENDLALERTCARQRALGALSRAIDHQLAALGLTAALLAVGWAMPAPARGHGLGFSDFFSAVTLYHLISFLVLFADRARALPERALRRRLWRRIAWVHGPAALVCVALLLAPGARWASLRYAIFSPAIYLFWSVLHVAQTLAARGVEQRPARAAGAARA